MVILIVTVVLALVVFGAVFTTMAFDTTIPMPIMGTFLALCAAGAVVGAGFLASATVTENTVNLTPVMTYERPLHALDTGTDTEGRFFLMSGYTESGPSYTYLTVREDGGYEMNSVLTRNAVVYQTDESAPRAVFGKVRPTSMLWSILPVTAKTEFYVPRGSVQEPDFRVDVQR